MCKSSTLGGSVLVVGTSEAIGVLFILLPLFGGKCASRKGRGRELGMGSNQISDVIVWKSPE